MSDLEMAVRIQVRIRVTHGFSVTRTRTRPAQNRVLVRVSFFTRGVHPKPEKNLKPERNPKKLKTWKKPEKIWKKPIYKTRQAPESDPKPDGFGCQISPMGSSSGVKFNLTTFFCWSGFWSTRPVAIPSPVLGRICPG
jgi:hypothetical protein